MRKAAKRKSPEAEKEYNQSMMHQVLQRLFKNPLAVAGFTVFLLLVILSVAAPVLTPYNPTSLDLREILQNPSIKHPFGTDQYGRDILTRLLYGGRTSLALGFIGAAIALAVGILIGTVSGYYGGAIDNVIMRFIEIIQSIPGMLFAIIISTVLGGGFINTCIALSISSIPTISRIIRAEIMKIRQEEYLEAAVSIRCSQFRIMYKHILPNVLSPVIVNAAMTVGATISQAAGLSYIGLGIQPPMAEWGAMLTDGKEFVRTFPWLVVWPGMCIGITVLAVNLFGDGLRDALDPKLKD